jgi:hypothetical protein
LTSPGAEGRPALVADDVRRLEVSGLATTPIRGDAAAVRLVNVEDAVVQGCRAPAGTSAFAEIEGHRTRGVALIANDLTRAARAVRAVAGASLDQVALAGNASGGADR